MNKNRQRFKYDAFVPNQCHITLEHSVEKLTVVWKGDSNEKFVSSSNKLACFIRKFKFTLNYYLLASQQNPRKNRNPHQPVKCQGEFFYHLVSSCVRHVWHPFLLPLGQRCKALLFSICPFSSPYSPISIFSPTFYWIHNDLFHVYLIFLLLLWPQYFF